MLLNIQSLAKPASISTVTLRTNTKTVGIRILRVKLDYVPRVLVVVDELTIFSGKIKGCGFVMYV